MDSYQAIIGWKRMRKREDKNYRSVMFQPDTQQKISKKQQKNSKIPLWIHFKPKQAGIVLERKKIKIIVPFRSNPTRNRKFQKNSKKFKKLKNTIIDSIQAKIGWNSLRKIENNNYSSVPFQPDQ